jgi:cytochrome c2
MTGRFLARWIVTAAAAAAMAGAAAVAGDAQPLFSEAQDPAAGARVFDDKGCARCHATDGEPARDASRAAAPNLARVARPRTFFDLGAALWNHAPRMSARMRQLGLARPRLEPRDAADLAGYLYTLDYFERKGRPEVGGRIFTTKRCHECHRIGGRGGAVGPPLDQLEVTGAPIALAAVLWNHGPQMGAMMQALGVERPTFKAGELIDLIAYLNQASASRARRVFTLPGRADAGLRVFTERRCVECHTIGTAGPPGTIDLVERAGRKSLTDFVAAMWNKAPAMRDRAARAGIALPTVTAEEMSDLVALLYASQYFARSGDPAKGVAVATAKGCLGCHGLHGERGKSASDLATAKTIDTPAGVLAALWNHAFLDDPRPGDERRTLHRVSGSELADLVAYLRSLTRRR